jgi:uncharacterized protein YndB with AHSA1/START domain
MTVTSVDKDLESLTITLIADFDAPIERVWQLWADPRMLERWWGPPTYPATVEKHELTPDGEIAYFMTSPEGEKYHGWWRVTSVGAPTSLEFTDGFAHADGTPNNDLPISTVRMQLSEHKGGTRMELRSSYDSQEHMQQVIDMGVMEGLREAAGQMDALLAA